ncbi:MAG: hypothetical protein ABIH57_02580 [Candidatus Omnitrophota bacterium]
MQKIRYELDPYNRLVLGAPAKKSSLLKFRRVLDGRFKLNENNELTYHVKSPLSREIPHQIKLRGKWSLDNNHNLCLTLDKKGRETLGDQVTLQGEILDVKKNSLLFAVVTRTKENKKLFYVLNLEGRWAADKFNRLLFHVKKEKGEYDILTLKGAWEINKNHNIIYEYKKAKLAKIKQKTHTLTFKGFWDIRERMRLRYVLSKGTDSVFSFESSAGIFMGRYIKYEVGVGLSDRKDPIKRTITLYGKWKLTKNSELIFQVKYENKKIHDIVFKAEIEVTDKDKIAFKLKNDIGNNDIGATLKMSRKILKGSGEIFLQILKSRRESALYAGSAWKW